MKWIAWCGAFVLVAVLSAAAQQNPFGGAGGSPPGAPQPGTVAPNRPPAPATGTARIRGRVVSDLGAPVRGAEVMLSGDLARRTETDDTGRFEFTELPAGRFTMNATKGGYAVPPSTAMSFDPSRSFILADAQLLNRDITLLRGGVIRGRIVDEIGEPVSGLEVRVERYTYGPGGRQLATFGLGLSLSPLGLTTNDLGEFRIYGLTPGEYVISARTRSFGATLATGRGGARDSAVGFVPTYYPGTTRAAQAQTLKVAAAQEAVANFAVVPGRLVRISGMVRNSRGLPATGLNVFLGVETATTSGQLNGGGVAADGSFSIGNVPPGDYVLRVRQQGLMARGAEVASMPISVTTDDLGDLQLTTRPGATIRGRVEWQGTSARPTNPVRINTRSAEFGAGPLGGESTITYLDLENGTVREDDSFELGGIVGKVLFSVGPAQPWSITSVSVDGKDVTDAGVEAASLDGDPRVLIVLTDQATNVSGTVRDARRQPVTEYAVVVLPQQTVTGMPATRYTRFLRADADGTFRVRGLPPGDYVAGAAATLEAGREWDPAIQKIVRSSGERFTLSEGQSLTLTLDLLR